MPEGDTIFRAARALDRALAGRRVAAFESAFPALVRVDRQHSVVGRTIERVTSRGKHLLIWFSGGMVLRTHLRMHGVWHLYAPDHRWRRPRHAMRIRVATDTWEAIAFDVPDAEFIGTDAVAGAPALRDLGPDLLGPDFDPHDVMRRLAARPEMEIGDALLDQRALAGIGNIHKSEALFASGVSPFAPVGELPPTRVARVVMAARRLLAANAAARSVPRRVYGRGGEPCRRCGTVIERRAHGPNRRVTYWCPTCQPG